MRITGIVLTFVLAGIAAAQEGGAQRDARLQNWLVRYPEADANKDGILTLDEAQAYRAKLTAKQKAGPNRRPQSRPEPTEANVRYGPHERNVFDLWLPAPKNEEKALPVFVFFHGGGFVGGDKSSFDPTPYLNAGIAAVSGNYRLVDGRETLSPTPLEDAARVIQYLRHRANEWNLDGDRIAVSGSSAGAVISIWIGYHDDLADPDSDDPVARQATRVKCIVPLNGPTNLDPKWITANMGGPRHVHGSLPKMFGATIDESDRPEVQRRIKESSPIEHASADDPPTLLIYTGPLAGIPLPDSASTGALIHHAYFGKILKDKLDALGVKNRFLPQTDPRKDGSKVIIEWLREEL